MKSDPLSTALRHISETRGLLEQLIISSERFDYPKAKVALRQLEKKVKELSKTQARLEKMRSAGDVSPETAPNIKVVDFRTTSAANQ